MKQIIFILFFFFPSLAYSQEPISVTEVVEVTGVNKNELFIRGREWFNENFKSSKDVLQIIDKETGELSGKGVFTIPYVFQYMGEKKAKTTVLFQLNLWVKDGKYKYELTNLCENELGFGVLLNSDQTKHKLTGFNEKRMNDMYLSIKTNTIAKATLLINDLKIKMSKTSKSNDW